MKHRILKLSIVVICVIFQSCGCHEKKPKITDNPLKDPKYWSEIPAGTDILGSPENEPCRGAPNEYACENQVEVTLTNSFIMKKTEVTQAEWEAVGFHNPDHRKDPQLPFASANWFEALAFCNRMSELEGLETCYDLSSCTGKIGSGCRDGIGEDGNWGCNHYDDPNDHVFYCPKTVKVRKFESNPYKCPGYRLPTRAEWEYAARAGTNTATYNGDITTTELRCVKDDAVDPIAWYCFNSTATGKYADVRSQKVGQKLPNDWGLYDMLGNMMEWVDFVYTNQSMVYDELKSGWNSKNTEKHLFDPVGPPEWVSFERGVSGGYFGFVACLCRAAFMMGHTGSYRMSLFGFRPVKTIFKPGNLDAGPDGGKE